MALYQVFDSEGKETERLDPDGLWIDGEKQREATPQELAVMAAQDAQSQSAVAVESVRRAMFDVADLVRDWNEDAAAWLLGPSNEQGVPLYGAYDATAFLSLYQQVGAVLRNYNALNRTLITDVTRHQWQALMALAAEALTLDTKAQQG